MALMIWLKEPPMQIIVEGELTTEVVKEWFPRGLWRRLFPRKILVKHQRTGQPILFSERNVLLIRQITEEEIAEAKVRAEELEAAAAENRGRNPFMTFPGGRRH
jgi:hypothetical protein